MALVEQDVLGPDVTVDDAAPVRVVQRFGDLAHDVHRGVDRQAPLAREPVTQRLPGDEGHDVIAVPAGLAAVVQGEDVRVAELGGDADLAAEALVLRA